MRRAPQSTEIDNPLAAGVVSLKKAGSSNYKVPQDVMLENKHSKQFDDVRADKTKSRDTFQHQDDDISDRGFVDDYQQKSTRKGKET